MTLSIKRILIVMLVGVALYGVFVAYAGYSEIRQTLVTFRWSAFLGALALASFNYVLRFAKWEYYLARLGIKGVAKSDSFLIFLSGFVLTVTPGKVGEVFKSAVLSETHGISADRTAPIIVAERLTDVIAVILLIAVGSIGFSGGLPWAVAGTALVGIGMVFILWQAPARAFIRWLKSGPTRFRGIAPRLETALDSLRVLASPGALLLPTALSVVGWGAEGYALYLLLQGFGAPTPAPLAAFFYATATLAGAIIPVPGGLGVAETMIQEQLVRLGSAEQSVATAAMILIRFATLWYAVLVGFVALFLIKRRYPKLLA